MWHWLVPGTSLPWWAVGWREPWIGESGKNCGWGASGFLLPVTAAGSELGPGELGQKLDWDDGGLGLVSCRIWAGVLELWAWICARSLCLEFCGNAQSGH